jgi:2-iminobutanoate/2-iminopropanoate deaminase
MHLTFGLSVSSHGEEAAMEKRLLQSAKLAKPAGIFSSGVKVPAGQLIFVSGQVARNAAGETVGRGDIRAQTRQALENVKAVLEAAGATMDDIVKVTVFVTDVSHLTAIHEVRAEYFTRDYPGEYAGRGEKPGVSRADDRNRGDRSDSRMSAARPMFRRRGAFEWAGNTARNARQRACRSS